jgi:hypothetical protein
MLLERQAGNNGALSRQLDRGHRARIAETRVNPAEAGRCLTCGASGLRRQSIRKVGILHTRAIEDVGKFRADVHVGALLDAERPSHRDVLGGPLLETIVVEICQWGGRWGRS